MIICFLSCHGSVHMPMPGTLGRAVLGFTQIACSSSATPDDELVVLSKRASCAGIGGVIVKRGFGVRQSVGMQG